MEDSVKTGKNKKDEVFNLLFTNEGTSNMTSRNWVFTLHADEKKGQQFTWPLLSKDESPLGDWMKEGDILYLVYQVEKAPETGKVHMQGYLQLGKCSRLSALKKISGEAHWEARRGTHEEARDYCKKPESRIAGPWEHGKEKNDAGKRTDLQSLHSLVKEQKTHGEILELTGGTSARYEKAINYMKFCETERLSDRQLQGVRVIVLYGPTGTGKTYAAVNYMANNCNYYIAECPSHKDSRLWFNGYDAQPILILDDFSGNYCTFHFLLRLLDKYKLKVEYKGGFVWACWTTVIITSNAMPDNWYERNIDNSPLKRRIHEIRKVTEQGLYEVVNWECERQGDTVAWNLPAPVPVATTSTAVADADIPETPGYAQQAEKEKEKDKMPPQDYDDNGNVYDPGDECRVPATPDCSAGQRTCSPTQIYDSNGYLLDN
nr:MAG: replication associated protein [Arizlama virus]